MRHLSPESSPLRKVSPKQQSINGSFAANPSSVGLADKKKSFLFSTIKESPQPQARLMNTSRASDKSLKKTAEPSLKHQPQLFNADKLSLTYYSKLALKHTAFKISSNNAEDTGRSSSRKSSVPQTNANSYYLKLTKRSTQDSKASLFKRSNSNQETMVSSAKKTDLLQRTLKPERAPPASHSRSIATSRKHIDAGTREASMESSTARQDKTASKFNISAVIRKIKDENTGRKDQQYLLGATQNQQFYKRKGVPTSKNHLLRSVFEK